MTDAIVSQAQTYLAHVPLSVVSQGAEAVVFETKTHPYSPSVSRKCIIKYRPPKPYRHPTIDAALTRSRTIGEAKFMAKLAKLGLNCPHLVLVDFAHGIIWMDFIGRHLGDGSVSSLKNWLWMMEKGGDPEKCVSEEVRQILVEVGSLIASLHLNDMIHGDLTSSNIILTDHESRAALIDFGLLSYSGLAEDKAVDLYVLERAIISTHSVYAEQYNSWIHTGYEQAHTKTGKRGTQKYAETKKKLEDVRLRGRKRSMLG